VWLPAGLQLSRSGNQMWHHAGKWLSFHCYPRLIHYLFALNNSSLLSVCSTVHICAYSTHLKTQVWVHYRHVTFFSLHFKSVFITVRCWHKHRIPVQIFSWKSSFVQILTTLPAYSITKAHILQKRKGRKLPKVTGAVKICGAPISPGLQDS